MNVSRAKNVYGDSSVGYGAVEEVGCAGVVLILA
jgi:hypothetical protein